MRAVIFMLVLCAAGSAHAAGVPTHQLMADRAIELVDSAEQPILRRLLETYRKTVLSGAGFPDSGYRSGIVLGPLGVKGNFGELAHWDHFIQGYNRYIRAQCADELPLTSESDLGTDCALMIAHMLGTAAHGLGDETWDFMFEPAFQQEDGSSAGAFNDLTTLTVVPEEVCGTLMCNGLLAQMADAIHPVDRGIRDAISDPSQGKEYNMDVALIAEFDRYDDVIIWDATSNAVADNVDAIDSPIPLGLQSYSTEVANLFKEQVAAGRDLPVARLPDPATLAAVANEACNDQTDTGVYADNGIPNCPRIWTKQDFFVAAAAETAISMAETILAPYDSTRVRDQYPWSANNYYLNSGGVIHSAQAIAKLWSTLMRRVGASPEPYQGPSVIATHPRNGEVDVPATTGDKRNRILVLLDMEYDWATIRPPAESTGIGGLMVFENGGDTPIAGQYRGAYFHSWESLERADWAGNRGRRLFWFEPAHPLKPATRYTVVATTRIADIFGNPLSAPVTWNFTTAAEAQP